MPIEAQLELTNYTGDLYCLGLCSKELHGGFSHFRTEELDYAEGASTGFMVASGGVISEGYGHGGPGVCLGDGQTEAEGVPSLGRRGDALLRRMPPIPGLICGQFIVANTDETSSTTEGGHG